MATFSLVHGAWGGGWLWDPLRAELDARGHAVHTPDLPCEDVAAAVEDYAAAVPAADFLVGHSLGGFTIPYAEAQTHVFVTALIGDTGWTDVFVPDSATGVSATRSAARTIRIRPLRRASSSIRPSMRT
jgi:pimeloyl-ACP methyl ester carboxylesterase